MNHCFTSYLHLCISFNRMWSFFDQQLVKFDLRIPWSIFIMKEASKPLVHLPIIKYCTGFNQPYQEIWYFHFYFYIHTCFVIFPNWIRFWIQRMIGSCMLISLYRCIGPVSRLIECPQRKRWKPAIYSL